MPTLITPKAILSYPHLFEPKAALNSAELKYSCSLVFGPGADLRELEKAAFDAAKEKFGDKTEGLIRAGKLRMPFRTDVEEKGYPEGSTFININSKQAPGLVDRYPGADGRPVKITDPDVLYPGCFVRASVRPFAYDVNGNKGVSFALSNIQKLGEGERLDGRRKAEDEFEAVEDSPADLAGVTANDLL